jgi:hypothetical protein
VGDGESSVCPPGKRLDGGVLCSWVVRTRSCLKIAGAGQHMQGLSDTYVVRLEIPSRVNQSESLEVGVLFPMFLQERFLIPLIFVSFFLWRSLEHLMFYVNSFGKGFTFLSTVIS